MKQRAFRMGVLWAVACAVVIGVGGCPPAPTPIPHTVSDYQKLQQKDPTLFHPRTVVMNNISRVLDPKLSQPRRLASLKLVIHLGGANEPSALEELRTILRDDTVPNQLRWQTLEVLLRNNVPGLSGDVVAVLPTLDKRPDLREAVLEWLARNPEPKAMAEVVKLWAREPVASQEIENRYREIVRRMTGKSWEQALVDAVNTPGFFARGSAMELLNRRVRRQRLAELILTAPSRTLAMGALQVFLQKMQYVPANGSEFLSTVLVYKSHQGMIDETAKLWHRWNANDKYRFNIRDFHLISRLAMDPLRADLRRGDLIRGVGTDLAPGRRPHVPARSPGSAAAFTDQFAQQVDKLTLADLWNLHLLERMLANERMQAALRLMAISDRKDTARAWGGLIFYANGRAEPKLYQASLEAGENDKYYVPGLLASRHGRDALCRFHAHFERADNSGRVGPDSQEMRVAREDNMYGLVLTSLGEAAFCAHYYTPGGVVVSLGKYPFRK
jgi:hypothetical protein